MRVEIYSYDEYLLADTELALTEAPPYAQILSLADVFPEVRGVPRVRVRIESGGAVKIWAFVSAFAGKRTGRIACPPPGETVVLCGTGAKRCMPRAIRIDPPPGPGDSPGIGDQPATGDAPGTGDSPGHRVIPRLRRGIPSPLAAGDSVPSSRHGMTQEWTRHRVTTSSRSPNRVTRASAVISSPWSTAGAMAVPRMGGSKWTARMPRRWAPWTST